MNEIKSADASVRAARIECVIPYLDNWETNANNAYICIMQYDVRTLNSCIHFIYRLQTIDRVARIKYEWKKAKRNCKCIQNVVVIQIWPSESLNRRSAHASDTQIQFTVHSNGYLFDQMELCRLIAYFSLSSSFSINDQQTKRIIKESAMHANDATSMNFKTVVKTHATRVHCAMTHKDDKEIRSDVCAESS